MRYLQAWLPPSSIFPTYLHANVIERKKNQKASMRPSASRNNHDEVHETTTHMPSMIQTTGNNKTTLQGQKLTTCWNPLEGLGKIWHELKGEWFYHARLRSLPNPLPHCISVIPKHICFLKLCQDILRIESQNLSDALLGRRHARSPFLHFSMDTHARQLTRKLSHLW